MLDRVTVTFRYLIKVLRVNLISTDNETTISNCHNKDYYTCKGMTQKQGKAKEKYEQKQNRKEIVMPNHNTIKIKMCKIPDSELEQ